MKIPKIVPVVVQCHICLHNTQQRGDSLGVDVPVCYQSWYSQHSSPHDSCGVQRGPHSYHFSLEILNSICNYFSISFVCFQNLIKRIKDDIEFLVDFTTFKVALSRPNKNLNQNCNRFYFWQKKGKNFKWKCKKVFTYRRQAFYTTRKSMFVT